MFTLNALPSSEIDRITKYFEEEYLIKKDQKAAFLIESKMDAECYEAYLIDRTTVESIPIFYLPITIAVKGITYCISDLRSLVSFSQDGIMSTRVPDAIRSMAMRAHCTLLKHKGEYSVFRGDLTLAGSSFVNMVTNILLTNWNMSHADSYYIRILAAILYGSSIPSHNYGEGQEIQKAYNDCRKWAGVVLDIRMDDFIRHYSKIKTVSDFISSVKEVSNSSRIKSSLTYVGILTPFTKTTYGPGSQIQLSVSMKNAEIYAGTVCGTIGLKSVRNTSINRDLDRVKKTEPYADMISYRERVTAELMSKFE